MDRTALSDFGVEDFSSMLRWAMKAEAEEAAASRQRNRRGWSRKKARLRWAGRGRAGAGGGCMPKRVLAKGLRSLL